MNLIAAALAILLSLVFALISVTRVGVWTIERRYPPVGAFVDVGDARIHYVHVPAGPDADLPPVVFIHGASANLRDQMLPLRPLLEGRAELLFFDRPGLGWSSRGTGNATLSDQADTLANLMSRLGIAKAVIVGHSLGGAVAAAFALRHPDKTAGLVLASAATHPWASRKTSWYYRLTSTPVVGWLFAQTLAYPGGSIQMAGATDCVFAPNPTPPLYLDRAQIPLVLRPSTFRSNAVDVQGLHDFATEHAPLYRRITARTVVISGDADTVVYEELHSLGLARDIPGAELVWIHNLGHKSDWIAAPIVEAAIEKVAGRSVDLQAMARVLEQSIAGDRAGEGVCVNEPAPIEDLSPS
jgi:pimeloyl-ACP methyl ester carboxylesterase